MLDFVIVEDNKEVLSRIKSAIISATMDSKSDIDIHSFATYDDELDSIINNQTLNKIYILDIELPGEKSGIDIAYQIRENDISSNIIVITNHDGLFETVYRNLFNVSDFIEKIPGFDKKLIDDIKIILTKGFDTECFIYHNRDIDLQLSYRCGRYYKKDSLKIISDNYGVIPSQNYHMNLYKTVTNKQASYSAIVIQLKVSMYLALIPLIVKNGLYVLWLPLIEKFRCIKI